METLETRNDFLRDLLALQQDGRLAISAPTNWIKNEPILEIPTDIDNIVIELQDALIRGTKQNETARWHFFVGSPGNGKSAAMGNLCRRLLSDKGCRLLDDEENIPILDLKPLAIPYAINVYERDNKFASAQIVQDASVVRKPFASKPDDILATASMADYQDGLDDEIDYWESTPGDIIQGEVLNNRENGEEKTAILIGDDRL